MTIKQTTEAARDYVDQKYRPRTGWAGGENIHVGESARQRAVTLITMLGMGDEKN